MNETEIRDMLQEAIQTYEEEGYLDKRIDVDTFEEHGVMTNNKGLVLRVGEKEFQITIVQSR